MEFEPPDFASRQLLRAGRITLVAQVHIIKFSPSCQSHVQRGEDSCKEHSAELPLLD